MLQAVNISDLYLRSSAKGQSVMLVSDEVHLSLPEDDKPIVAKMEFLPLRATIGNDWVTVNVHGGRAHQAVTFMVEISE
jgi:hypothetical protein